MKRRIKPDIIFEQRSSRGDLRIPKVVGLVTADGVVLVFGFKNEFAGSGFWVFDRLIVFSSREGL